MSTTITGPNQFTRKKLEEIKGEVNDEVLENIEVSIDKMKDYANTTTDTPGQEKSYLFTQGHLPQRLNIAKEVNLWLGNTTASKGDWRKQDYNGICNVSQRIRLYPENLNNLTLKFNYVYKDMKQPDSLVGGIAGDVKKMVDAAQTLGIGGKTPIDRLAPFDTIKAFEDLTSLQMDGSMQFKFHFGSAGFFSGLEEVVKPIYALIGSFALGKANDAFAETAPPLPTEPQFAAIFLKSAIQSLFNDNTPGQIKDAFSKGATEGGIKGISGKVVDAAAAAYNSYFRAINAGNTSIFMNKSKEWDLAYFQIGHFLVGPCTVGSFSWSMDMSNIDEGGYPISGSVTLGDIKTYAKATKGIITSTMFDGVKMT